jgi:hypothetical protein
VELLEAGGAVERHRIVSIAAVNDVAAVARVPHEPVIAGTERDPVGAAVSVHDVVAVATVQGLGPTSAEQGVIAALPLICVGVVVVKVPLESSIRT